MLISGFNIWTVVFLISCQCGRILFGGGVCVWLRYNTLLPHWYILRRSCVPHYTFKWCYQCANLRQTDHVANMVPEVHPICNHPTLCWIPTFLQHCDPQFQWLLVVCNTNVLRLLALSLSHPPACLLNYLTCHDGIIQWPLYILGVSTTNLILSDIRYGVLMMVNIKIRVIWDGRPSTKL